MNIPGSRRPRISRTPKSFAQSNFLAELLSGCKIQTDTPRSPFDSTLWLDHLEGFYALAQAAHIHCFVMSTAMNFLLIPSMIPLRLFFQSTRDNTFNRAITVSLLICQELQGDDRVITHTLRCSVCSKNFSLSRRSSVSCLTKAPFGALQSHRPP